MVSLLRTAVAANGRELSHKKSVTRASEAEVTEAENMENVFSRCSMGNVYDVYAYLLSFSISGLMLDFTVLAKISQCMAKISQTLSPAEVLWTTAPCITRPECLTLPVRALPSQFKANPRCAVIQCCSIISIDIYIYIIYHYIIRTMT